MSLGPVAAYVLALAGIYASMGGEAAAFLATLTAGCFIGAGKLVIFAGALEGAPLGVAPLAALVVFTDVAIGLVLLAYLDELGRVPGLGVQLGRAHEVAWGVLRTHRWMRRLTWSGVALFVAFPFQGAGAVIGVFLGRVMGLSRVGILSAVTLGSTAGSIPLALAGSFGRARITWLADNPFFGLGVLAAVLVVTIGLGRWITNVPGPAPSSPQAASRAAADEGP